MKRTQFPIAFQRILLEKDTDYAGLERAMKKKGHRLTKQFIGMMGNGQRNVPPKQLHRICETLGLPEGTQVRLHKAAAQDYGYKIS